MIKEFDGKITENETFLEDKIQVAGRVLSIRKAGKALLFIDLVSDAEKIQVMGKNDTYKSQEDFDEVLDIIKRGDIIGVVGKIGRTKTG